MVAVGLSLVTIAFFCLAAAGLWVMAAAEAMRPQRRRSRQVEDLAHGCDVADLADIDRSLDAIMAEEHGGPLSGKRAA